MKRTVIGILLTCSALLVGGASSRTEAANPVGAQSDKLEIRKVLASETKDESVTVDRRAVLQPAVHPETASNASWWQSAFVKIGSGWRPVEKSHVDINVALLNEYRAQCDAAPKTAEGQLKLANWCQKQKLTDQERAHLVQVLILSGPGIDPAPIFARLGYRRIGEQWVSPSEFQAILMESQKSEDLRRHWWPKLERIALHWDGNARQRKQSQDELNGIVESEAIPALLAASETSESLALAICQRLSNLASFESSQGLAMMAVQSEWSTARQSATTCLRGRKLDDFAPALLGMMRTPLSMKSAPRSLGEERLIFREEKDRFVAIDLRVIPDNLLLVFSRRKSCLISATTDRNRSSVTGPRSEIDRTRFIEDIDHQLQLRLDEENDHTEEYNRRAASVLAEVSGQQPSPNPRYWWMWWHLYTATEPLPKRRDVLTDTVFRPGKGLQISLCSCLIAGTPIWTERGPVAIELIQVGDRVLAKDVDTGEIAYKPVLQTTARQPVPVKKFVVGGEPIVASDGHHFWSSGIGWTKTRDLKANLPIHTVSGMSRVESTESEPQPAPVYNLVIADFNTYFVGAAMVLSHDVTPPAPTNVKVPGLVGSLP